MKEDKREMLDIGEIKDTILETFEITTKKKGKKYQYYLAQIQGYGNVTSVPEELIIEISKLLG